MVAINWNIFWDVFIFFQDRMWETELAFISNISTFIHCFWEKKTMGLSNGSYGRKNKESSSNGMWDDIHFRWYPFTHVCSHPPIHPCSSLSSVFSLHSSLPFAPSFSVLSLFHLRPGMPNCSQLAFSLSFFSLSLPLLFPSVFCPLFSPLSVCCVN